MTERSKTVDQALRLLASVASDDGLTVSELARRADLNRTVAHRLLASLGHARLVRRGDDGRWRLGLALLELAARVETDVRQAARPVLDGLAHAFGETAVLSVPDGADVVALEQALGERHPVRVAYRPGTRHPQHRGAHGRALLAFAEPDHVEAVLAGVDDGDTIRRKLADVRRRGYAISHNELQFGASGLAAPVRDAEGRALATIGVVAPVGRLPDEAVLAPAVLEAARHVAQRLESERITERGTHHAVLPSVG